MYPEIEKAIEQLSAGLNQKLEDLMIEGLKKKGIYFDNRPELIAFVTNNCKCEDNTDLKERIYFANDLSKLRIFFFPLAA